MQLTWLSNQVFALTDKKSKMGWWHDVDTWKWDESGGEEMHHTFDVMNVVLLGWKSDVFHTLINILIRNESRSIWKMQRLCICITQPHYRSTPSSQTPSFLRPTEDFLFVGACLQESQSDFCWLPCDEGQIPMCSRVGCFWLCWLQKRCTKQIMFRMQVWPWEANQRCWFTPTHHALAVYHCFLPLYAMTERTPKGWQLRFYENKAWSHHVANVVCPPAWPSRPPKTRKKCKMQANCEILSVHNHRPLSCKKVSYYWTPYAAHHQVPDLLVHRTKGTHVQSCTLFPIA